MATVMAMPISATRTARGRKEPVENTIGRLRRDMPRKTQRQDYSDADFDDIIFMHNNTPRKCLGFKTPAEAFLTEFNRVALGL